MRWDELLSKRDPTPDWLAAFTAGIEDRAERDGFAAMAAIAPPEFREWAFFAWALGVCNVQRLREGKSPLTWNSAVGLYRTDR